MQHRPFVWSPRSATILVCGILVLCAACAAPAASPNPPAPPVAASAATRSVQPASTPTAPPPPSATVPAPSPSPTEQSTPTPTAATKPVSLRPIQTLAETAIVDVPMRDVRAVTTEGRKYRIAAWSPRGTFAAATPQDGPGIDIVNLATGETTTLVSDTYVLEPRWTHDGALIVHTVEDDGDIIRLFDPAMGEMTTPLARSAPLSAPDINGARVVFNRDGDLIVCDVPCATERRVLPDGALVTALAPGASNMLAWNPVTARLEDVRTVVVSLTSPDAIPYEVSLPGEGLWLPRWSPDGTRIALTSVEGRLVVVDPATGTRQDLGPGDAPAWSPDGRRIAYAGTSAGLDYTTRNIHVARADGSGQRERLTNADEDQFYVSPSWSPDGTQILFVELDSGQLFVGTVPER